MHEIPWRMENFGGLGCLVEVVPLARGAYHVLFRIAHLALVLYLHSALTCDSTKLSACDSGHPPDNGFDRLAKHGEGSQWV